MAFAERRNFAIQHKIPFDPNLRRAQIVAPSVLCLERNFEGTVSLLQEIRDTVFTGRQPALLHLSNVEEIEVAAVLALAAEVYCIRHTIGKTMLTGTYPRNKSVLRAMDRMGYFKMLEVVGDREATDEHDPDEPHYLKFFTHNRAEPEIADMFVESLEGNLFELNALARQRLVGALKEAMGNTDEHAHPEGTPHLRMRRRWWMSAWISPSHEDLTVAFYDMGVGIPNTIKLGEFEAIINALMSLGRWRFELKPTDSTLIAAATEYHRSGTGSDERGRGFTDMKRFVDTCDDGVLRVISNRGTYIYRKDGERTVDHRGTLGGTIVEWSFRHGGKVELYDAA